MDIRAPRHRIGNRLGDRLDVVFQFHPCLHDFELHWADSSHDRGGITTGVIAQNLHHALRIKLFQPFPELLIFTQRLRAQRAKVLWGELWHRRILHLAAGENRVPRGKRTGVDQPNDVTGECCFHRAAGAPEHRQCIFGGKTATRLGMGDLHSPVELPRDHAHKGQGVAVVAIHARLDLEHHTGEIIINVALRIHRCCRCLNRLHIPSPACGGGRDSAQGI